MATPNKSLEQPPNGSFVGIWDQPMNSNTGIIDNSFGGMATIALGATGVVLSAAQYQCVFLRFTGAITANISIQFPSVGSFYTIINDCTNVASFGVYGGTIGFTQFIGFPPGVTDIMCDGINMRYRSLPPVGSYLQMAGNSIPLWIQLNSAVPYLNCNGTAFSAVTFPLLASLLGGTTLPDLRGRAFYTTDQGTSRITGIVGGTYGTAGGDQLSQIHSHGFSVASGLSNNDINHTHYFVANIGGGANYQIGGFQAGSNQQGETQSNVNTGYNLNVHTHNVNGGVQNQFAGGSQNLPPLYVGGLTLIRAA